MIIEPFTVGIFCLLLAVVLMLLGVPVAFSMLFSGFVGLVCLTSLEAALRIVAMEFYNTFSSYSLSVISAFLFMGSLASATGMSERLYKAAYDLWGRLPGGLAVATVWACAGFAAVCGSTTATAAAVAKPAVREMRNYNYADAIALGTVASGGVLGILIPPSTVFIVYGILTEQSIGKLFVAGICPGLLLASIMSVAVMGLCWLCPQLGPAGPRTSMKDKIGHIPTLLEAFIIFVCVILGLASGLFTAIQSGAVGVALILIASVLRRKITGSMLLRTAADSLPLICMIMMLLTGGMVFGRLMGLAKVPFTIAESINKTSLPPLSVMALIILLHLIGGCFMDAFAMIIITVPILFPIVVSMGFDPIWFGVILVLICEVGAITPPYGINVFMIKGLFPEVPIGVIFKGVTIYVLSGIAVIGILLICPSIATFLPKMFG
ncbi:MAG: TRAP transporter large permease [Candidatus Bathyarchaeia archaeon]